MLTTVEKDALVWLSTSSGYSVPAKIIEVDPITVQCLYTVIAEVLEVFIVAPSVGLKKLQQTDKIIQLENTLRLTTRKEFDTNVENLSSVADETESALVLCLRKRFEKKRIYTFAGTVLLAINPYEALSIYDNSVANLYRDNPTSSKSAHIFAIAENALTNIKNDSPAETICFCGESGSGKSTNLLQTARYIVASSNARSTITVEKIEAFLTLIHAFCGAKTRKNDTATRVGYCFDLLYKNGSIQGIVPKLVLPLELVRLVSQQQGERNFDVFYQMCAGIDQNLRHKYGLKEAQKYFYLNLGKCANEHGVTEQEKFNQLQNALNTLEISDDQQQFIFRVLSAILHLGNLFFTSKQNASSNAETPEIEIGNEAEIKWTAYLLELDIDQWRSLFIERKTFGEGATSVPLTIDQALDMRDSIAQTIYNSLIQWIISIIGYDYGCLNYTGIISLFDFYGFERYNNNAYEQLCVNTVNEWIENFYIKKVFKEVEEEFQKEAVIIDYQVPSWIDNKRVMDLLLKRPDGLVFLLDDECKFPKASNEGFLRRCDLNHSENGVYGKSRAKDRLEFAVKHFGGFTYYSADHFVQKNRRQISAQAIQLLSESQNASVAQIFKNFTVNGKTLQNTDTYEYVAQTYGQSVKALIDKLDRTNCQFVRCFRSNNERQPVRFCHQTVIRQIRACALLDTAKISRRGYNIKHKITDFAKRYSCLLPKEANDYQSINEKVNDILEQQGCKFNDRFAIGKTNVYVKENLHHHLEKLRNGIREKSAIILQKSVRGMLARRKFKKQRNAAVVLQSGLRAWKARKEIELKRAEMIKKIDMETKKLGRSNDLIECRVGSGAETGAVVQYLDLPEDLQKQLAINRNPKMFKTRTTTRYYPMSVKYQIPKLPRLIPIEEFAESCFKGHLLGSRREPIVTPFLAKDNDEEFKEALLIFKLILRYTNDTQFTDEELAVLGKYIIQKGIDMPEQRDEIYVQLCNQTYNNRVKTSTNRAWTLMLAACNSFAPSIHVFPMLMSYFQTVPEHLSNMLICGLLRRIRNRDSVTNRLLASTFLEQAGFKQQQFNVLRIQYPNNEEVDMEADAWMTAGEMAKTCLRLKGIGEPEGWSLSLVDQDWTLDAAVNQYLYDIIAQRELLTNYSEDELPSIINETFFAVFDNEPFGKADVLNTPLHTTPAQPTMLTEYMEQYRAHNSGISSQQHYSTLPAELKNREGTYAENKQSYLTGGYRINNVDSSEKKVIRYDAATLPLQRSGVQQGTSYMHFTTTDLYQPQIDIKNEADYGIIENNPKTEDDRDAEAEKEMQKRYRQKQREFAELSRQELRPQFAYIPQQNSMPFVPGQVHFIPVMLPTTSFVPPQVSEGMRQFEKPFADNRPSNYKNEQNDQSYNDTQDSYRPERNDQYCNNYNEQNFASQRNDSTGQEENQKWYSKEKPIIRQETYHHEEPVVRQEQYSHERVSKPTHYAQEEHVIRQQRQPQIPQHNGPNKACNEEYNEENNRFYSKNSVTIDGCEDNTWQYTGNMCQHNNRKCNECSCFHQAAQNQNERYNQDKLLSKRPNREFKYDMDTRKDKSRTTYQPHCKHEGYHLSQHYHDTSCDDGQKPMNVREISNEKNHASNECRSCRSNGYGNGNRDYNELGSIEKNPIYEDYSQTQHHCTNQGCVDSRLYNENQHHNGEFPNKRKYVVEENFKHNENYGSGENGQIGSFAPNPERFFDDKDFFAENWSYNEHRPDYDSCKIIPSQNQTQRQNHFQCCTNCNYQNAHQHQDNRPVKRQPNDHYSTSDYRGEHFGRNYQRGHESTDSYERHQEKLEKERPERRSNSDYRAQVAVNQRQIENQTQDQKDNCYRRRNTDHSRSVPDFIETVFPGTRTYNIHQSYADSDGYCYEIKDGRPYEDRELESTSRPCNQEVILEECEESFAKEHPDFSSRSNYLKDQKPSPSNDCPSASTRIRHIQIPSHNSDVDKFLDAVFEQALPQSELDRTNETKMNTSVIARSIKGGANGPPPANSDGSYRINDQGNSMVGQLQAPPAIPQPDYNAYAAQPMMFMMPVDGRTLMQQQPLIADTSMEGRCLSPVIPVMFPPVVPSSMMVCLPSKQAPVNCASPPPSRNERIEEFSFNGNTSLPSAQFANFSVEIPVNGEHHSTSLSKSSTAMIRTSPLPMSLQSQQNRDELLQNGQVGVPPAKARFLDTVHSEANDYHVISSSVNPPVSSSIKQIQQEALSKLPQSRPLLNPTRNNYQAVQPQQYIQNDVPPRYDNREPPHSILRINGERHDNLLQPQHNEQYENVQRLGTKSHGRLHRIAFEDYNEPVVRGDITNSEHYLPGRLPIPPPLAKTSEVEKDALRKLREKAKELPPPVDEARFLKPNLRKKQMDLHFKSLPPEEEPVFSPVQQMIAPEPEPIDIVQQSRGHWVYQSDVVREDSKETRARSEPLHGNFYARGLPVANEVTTETQTPPLQQLFLKQDQENIDPSHLARQKEKPAVQYEVKPWALTIRKELFNPYEQLDDIHEINLLFSQIITDCRRQSRYRIRQYEREEINKILRDNVVPPDDLNHPERIPVEIKINIIEAARRWPLYFSRFYNVIEERDNEHVSRMLGISESGVRLIARNINNTAEPLFISDHFEYNDIAELAIDESKEHLQIVSRKGLIITIRSEQSKQIQNIIEKFITGAGKNKIYVRATADYITKEPNLLSFKKDDVIQIITRSDQKNDPDGEWLFGKIGNRYGNLPANYVEPIEQQIPATIKSQSTYSAGEPPFFREGKKEKARF